MYLQYSRPFIYHLFPNVWKASYTISTSVFVDVPYYCHRARISSSFVLHRHLAVILILWRRDRNRMDSCRVGTVDVPESPISSGLRAPWQQQRCDSLQCYEEWWDSVPQSVATCFTQSLKTFLRNTSIVIRELCCDFVNMVLGRSHHQTSVNWESTPAAGCTNSPNSPCSYRQSWQLSNSPSSWDSSVSSTLYPSFA